MVDYTMFDWIYKCFPCLFLNKTIIFKMVDNNNFINKNIEENKNRENKIKDITTNEDKDRSFNQLP